ncbi:UNVERIFIED_ORG: putative membrane protein YeaQ/YmgE (transglycosylase-associated protein family) [Rhizobium esperanzae]
MPIIGAFLGCIALQALWEFFARGFDTAYIPVFLVSWYGALVLLRQI